MDTLKHFPFWPIHSSSNFEKWVAAAENTSLQPARESPNTRLFAFKNKELDLDILLYASVTIRWDFTDMVLKVSNINMTNHNVISCAIYSLPAKHQLSTLEGPAISFDN